MGERLSFSSSFYLEEGINRIEDKRIVRMAILCGLLF